MSLIVGFLALFFSARAPAQDPLAFATPPSAEEIQARMAELESQTGLAPEVREGALVPYGKALEALQRVAELRAVALDFERMSAEAPALLEAIRAELLEPTAAPDLTALSGQDLTRLAAEKARVEAELQAARSELAQLNTEATVRSERTGALPAEIARLRGELAALEGVIQAAPRAENGDARAEAVRVERLARRELLAAEIRALEAELTSSEVRKDLLPARRDRATRRVGRNQALSEALAALVAERRQAEARDAQLRSEALQAELRRQAPRAEELQALAQRNEELAAFRSSPKSPGVRIEATRKSLAQAEVELASILRRFAQTRLKIRAAGLTNATGRLLLTQLQSLPDERELEDELRERQVATSEEDFQLILLQEEREDFVDPESRLLPELLLALGAPTEGPERDALATVARDLLRQRQNLLDVLIEEYEEHIGLASELDRTTARTIEAVAAYRTYIEERILWVRSVEAENLLDALPKPRDAWSGLLWLVSPSGWARALSGWVAEGRILLWSSAAGFALLLSLLYLVQRYLRHKLESIGEHVRRYRTDNLWLTLRAALVTLLLAAPAPLSVLAVGWSMDLLLEDSELVRSVSRGLIEAGTALIGPAFMLSIARKEGLGEVHFRWAGATTRALRIEMRSLATLIGPLVFLFTCFWEQARSGDPPHEEWSLSIGRTAFVAYTLAIAVFARRVLRPDGTILGESLERTSAGLLSRTRALWYPAAIVLPLSIALLALAGYYYTAERLYGCLILSARFLFALVLVNAVLQRWLFITRRRLAIEQARARALARAEKATATIATESGTTGIEEEKLDIPALDEKTRQLFRSGMTVAVALGLYFIWGSTLPALRGLERVSVYPAFEVRSAQVLEDEILGDPRRSTALTAPGADASRRESPTAAPSGAPSGGALSPMALVAAASPSDDAPEEASDELVISLADVILSLLVLVLTAIAALNFPALLEIALLQRLPLDSGSRYAITSLARYAITIVGISWAAGALGIGWSQIQWLAAALTFGLAFGLQEIFANFVSGLILLAERPIRIGDFVTIGNVDGVVSRMRMRATLITDWDRREHLVPNKEFITGSLINWTLTDPVSRIVVPVGVAYGSDTKLVHELLLRCAKESDQVLAEPAPTAIFRRFGESSLDFELRIFIPHRDRWPHVTNEIHMSIDAAFRAAGIEIAFPQRDVHIRTGAPAPGLQPPT